MEDIKFEKPKLLNKKEILSIFIGKPLNFNNKQITEEELEKNYKIIKEKIGYNFDKVIRPKQNHTTNIGIVTKDNIDDAFDQTDGLVTSIKGIALGICVADCQAIMLYDPVNEIIANIHSGWKGTLNKIIVNAVEIMINEFNCNPENLIVYISPSINRCCFEVDEDVKDMFLDSYNNIEDCVYEKQNEENKQKFYIDTIEINRRNLIQMGVKEENIEISSSCTKCNGNIYYSYRNEKENSGRNLAIICMKK